MEFDCFNEIQVVVKKTHIQTIQDCEAIFTDIFGWCRNIRASSPNLDTALKPSKTAPAGHDRYGADPVWLPPNRDTSVAAIPSSFFSSQIPPAKATPIYDEAALLPKSLKVRTCRSRTKIPPPPAPSTKRRRQTRPSLHRPKRYPPMNSPGKPGWRRRGRERHRHADR